MGRPKETAEEKQMKAELAAQQAEQKRRRSREEEAAQDRALRAQRRALGIGDGFNPSGDTLG